MLKEVTTCLNDLKILQVYAAWVSISGLMVGAPVVVKRNRRVNYEEQNL